jgi:ABC-type bacteriocin/lantibiotic exporter with double-glycine peptidase domain
MPKPLAQELRWLGSKMRPHISLLVASFLCLSLASLMVLITPLCMRILIDSILPRRNYRLLYAAVGLIFVSFVSRAILNAVGGYLTFLAAQRTALGLRLSLLRHVNLLSADYHDRTPVGETLYPFGTPIDEISYFSSDLLPTTLRTIVASVTSASGMILLSPILASVAIPVIPAFLIIGHHYRVKIGHEADAVQREQSKFSSFLLEHFAAKLQIQLLRHTQAQELKTNHLLTNVICCQEALWKTSVFYSVFSSVVIVTGLAAILYGGSLMVLSGKLTTGTLVAFYALLTQLFDSLSSVSDMYSRAHRIFASIRLLRAATEIAPAVVEHPDAKPLYPHSPLNIEFRDVRFGYRDSKATVHIPHLEILQGERVAIVGPNGSGKSTLVKLLARLYDVESGTIYVAGSDIRMVQLDSLRSFVSYLPPQPALLHLSVADNLRIGGSETSERELEDVLRIVGLPKFDKFGLCIGPDASNLSSGERQRLAIARMLLHPPRIVILDEATSSLDPAFEETVLRTLDKRMPNSTVIFVSHRVHSLSWFGRILVLQDGRIVRDGSPSLPARTNPQ